MNEEMKKELLSWLHSTAAFVKEQAPLVVKDVLNAGIMEHIIWILIGLLALLIIPGIWWWTAKEELCGGMDDSDAGGVRFFLTTILTVTGVACVSISGYWLLVCLFAPRAYLIEFLK